MTQSVAISAINVRFGTLSRPGNNPATDSITRNGRAPGPFLPVLPADIVSGTARAAGTHQQRQAMDKTVADLNIEHFKKLLAAETDPVKRQTIERLLAEEEAKLALALARKNGPQDKT
jgi:hypothetical protein